MNQSTANIASAVFCRRTEPKPRPTRCPGCGEPFLAPYIPGRSRCVPCQVAADRAAAALAAQPGRGVGE